MRSVYMIRRGAHWVKDPALATAGFPWLSFRVKRDAEMWLLANGTRAHKIVLVNLRMWEPLL